MMNDNELMHYGVLGMKWGVHRGRVAQSYGKAVAKRNKLDKRVEVAKAKAQKWVKQMDKTFKGKNISQISKKHKDSGKNYVKRRVA